MPSATTGSPREAAPSEGATQAWHLGPSAPEPGRGAHVWRIELAVSEERLARVAQLLSDDERRRAERFRFDRDRRRWTAARAALRTILARYLPGRRPVELRFRVAPGGKPRLDGGRAERALQFSLSHAGDLALVAVARRRAVGVDVEEVRPGSLASDVERLFSPGERDALRAAAPESRDATFFRIWTRKEAYLKALGDGLSSPLHLFTVGAGPDGRAPLLEVAGDPLEPARWATWGFTPREGYAAALVVRGFARPPSFFTCEP